MFKINNKNAFTLVELIIVISIIAVLASLAFMALSGETAQARDAKRRADIKVIEDAIATSNGKNKPINYTTDHLDASRTTPDRTLLTTNAGDLRPLRGAYLIQIANGVFDSDVVPTAPRDPRNSRYVGSFLSTTEYQIMGTLENPDTKAQGAIVRGSFKQGMILDVLTDDITESATDIPVANPSRFVRDDLVKLDNEYMLVSSFNTVAKTIQVVRGCVTTSTQADTSGCLAANTKVHNKGASIKVMRLNSLANSLVCTNTWATATDGTSAVTDGNWATMMVSDDNSDDVPGVVCPLSGTDSQTIIDEGQTNLPYTINAG